MAASDVNGLRHRHVLEEHPVENEPPERPRVTATRRRVQGLPKKFVELLMSPLSFVLGDGEPEDPQAAARKFTHSLRRRYGENLTPSFEHTSFRDAVSTARTASKFLLVFLHSNIHDDADGFCRQAMCTARMRTYLNNSDCIISWAGCVQYAEGFGVSLSLGCATFPFLVLLSCVSQSLNAVEKITANLPADKIIDKLNIAVDRNRQILATARHVHQQRTEAQILREQQDFEYQESLAADRRREQQVREEKDQNELAQARNEAEKRRIEADICRAREEEKRRDEEDKAAIAMKRARVANGPTTRVPPADADYKTAVLKFHLHNGTRLDHVFYAHDPLERVRDFIDVEFYDRGIPIRNYELATNFPKKVYGPEQVSVTLTDAGLAPQALVFVQDLDS